MRRSVPVVLALVLAFAAGLLAGDRSPAPAGAAPAAQSAALSTYRLADTWSGVPWTLSPGRFADVADVSSAADGTLFVLDAYQQAVHVLAPDRTPLRAFELPTPRQGAIAAARLDVGDDGLIRVLSVSCQRCPPQSQLDTLGPDGGLLRRTEIDERYADVAVRDDGRVYLARSEESGLLGPPAVDVLDAADLVVASLKPPELDTPIRLDVAADGTLYVLQEIVLPAPPRPGGGGGPRPTPGPSSAGRGAIDQEAATPVPGVVIFAPDHRYAETVPFEFGIDVAVGSAGVFVARYGQVFALREANPISPPLGQRWTGRLSLEVPSTGGVVGGLAHCHFQGLIAFDRPADRPAGHVLEGALDRPPLEGPAYPLRADAGETLRVLQGRFDLNGRPANRTYFTSPEEPQSVQRWEPDGALTGQLGVCGATIEAAWTRDLAVTGADVYTMDAACVTRRPDDAFPAWTTCLDGLWGDAVTTHLAALDAEGGRVAVLDAGAGGVILMDPAGAVTARWQITEAGPTAPPVDVALDGDRVYLAYQGRAAVEARALDGTLVDTWALSDAPLSIAAGADGSVFVLGRGGWAWRHAPGGAAEAAWPLPSPRVTVRDIAVGGDGRVYVPFVDIDPRFGRYAEILDAGIWVFEPSPAPPESLPPGPGACAAVPDKRAAPARLPLGDTVEVTLEVEGVCPARDQPVQLAIVFDTSRSMSWGDAIDSARRSVLRILTRLDPAAAEVTLVTFDDAGALESPLTRDLVGVARRVAALDPEGDTRMAEGIDLARRELAARRDPAARQVLLLVTDANPKDQTLGALADAADAGIALAALVYEDGQDADPDFIALFEGRGGSVLYDPQEWDIAGFSDGLVVPLATDGLFETIRVVDRIPDNMRYAQGSARPPAAFDAAANSLTWQLAGVRAQAGVRLTYRLEPLEVGTWPTNVDAVADYVDALGAAGRLVFPVPEVTVYAPERHAVYLPIVLNERCLKASRPVDVVLVIDSSISMADPAAPGPTATKLDAARAAAVAFVRLLDLANDRAAVVAFSEHAARLSGLTPDGAALERALATLASTPGTRIDRGLAEAGAVLGERRPGALAVVVLLTDGYQNGATDPVLAEAGALKAGGAVVFTIGLGGDVDRALLEAVATTPDRHLASPAASDLAAIYARISERLACGG